MHEDDWLEAAYEDRNGGDYEPEDEYFPDTDPDWVDEQVLGEEYEANK